MPIELVPDPMTTVLLGVGMVTQVWIGWEMRRLRKERILRA